MRPATPAGSAASRLAPIFAGCEGFTTPSVSRRLVSRGRPRVGTEPSRSLRHLNGASPCRSCTTARSRARSFLCRLRLCAGSRTRRSLACTSGTDGRCLSAGLRAGDAIIAATAVENALPLMSANAKHFRPINELDLEAMGGNTHP